MFSKMIQNLKSNINKDAIVSFYTFRQVIGWLGMLLPFICVVAGKLFSHLSMGPSISSYYHTNARDFFVGLMICVSIFLITYKGIRVTDKIISTLIGIFGFGIALFPCLNKAEPTTLVGIFQLDPCITDKIHIGCAATFFFLLSINSFFLFTLPEDSNERQGSQEFSFDNKKNRNIIYRVCGIIMFLSVLILAVLSTHFFNKDKIDELKITLLLETVMLIAFGFSWLVKGKMIRFSLNLYTGGRNNLFQLTQKLSKFSLRGGKDITGSN